MSAIAKRIGRTAAMVAVSGGILMAQSTPRPSSEIDKHPDFHDEIPNKAASRQDPRTNSSLQEDQRGNMGSDYFGWLGLIGLAGLFGLSRGTNPAPQDGRPR
jgi:hypothetical protein